MLNSLFARYKLNLALSVVFSIALISLIALKGNFSPISFLPLVAGALLATFFLDLDFIFYSFFYGSNTPFAMSFREMFIRKNWPGLMEVIRQRENEVQEPLLRSALFQMLVVILTFYLVSSGVSILGTTFALGIFLQSLLLMWQRRAKDWFWIFRAPLSNNVSYVYVALMTVIFSYLTLTAF